jgi:antitoxin VapB
MFMQAERHVRLFKNGRNQAIRIPREFELDADEAIIHREGDRLIIEPVRKKGLLAVLADLQPIEDVFPDVDAGLLPNDDIDLADAPAGSR